MKLISCYIAGFGKIVDCNFSFEDDLVVFKENNGWGKSTLADFLRCMFYGLDGGRMKNIAANDRVKYAPWQGGAFGGTLTFAFAGRRYRIERFFGATPAQDVTRVFDGNNMPCYEFGDRAERLGETLFGVDGESYRKSVYIPQGDIPTGTLPDTIKGRLTALLTSATECTGDGTALEKLEDAERRLRAKRRPAKGKLDELDERLEEVARRRVEGVRAAEELAAAQALLAQRDGELQDCARRLGALAKETEILSRQSERMAKEEALSALRFRLQEEQSKLAQVKAFFKEVDPATVNIEGLRKGIAEFYDLCEEITQIEEKRAYADNAVAERDRLLAKRKDLQSAMDSYDMLLGKKAGAGTSRTKKFRFSDYHSKWSTPLFVVGLFLTIFGAAQAVGTPWLGFPILGIGTLGLIVSLFMMIPRGYHAEKKPPKKQDDPMRNAEFAQVYRNTEKQLEEIKAGLQRFPADLDEEFAALSLLLGEKRKKIAERESAVRNFLNNFAFGEIYDYREAHALLQRRLEAYEEGAASVAELAQSLQSAEDRAPLESSSYTVEDLPALQAQADGLSRRREELLSERARLAARLEQKERETDVTAVVAEETWLAAEKSRLERRLLAIRAAKAALLRARENMASKYLVPVEKRCRAYLSFFRNGESEKLRFTADGAPTFEEGGRLRETDYYSAGFQELLGVCLRISLADVLFERELPALIMDDPFVNLDDEKTELAKKLVRELSKRYQIVYFTCKKERTP